MDYSNVQPVSTERRQLLLDVVRDARNLAQQVIDTSPALNPEARHALEVLVVAATNARRVLGGGA